MNPDRVAATIAMVAMLLAAWGLPSSLEISPQWVTAAGGIVLGLAGIVRGLLAARGGKRVDWRDLLGAALGVVAVGLGIEGNAVDQLDADALGAMGSLGAMVFAAHRGLAALPPGAAPPTGLVLLVLLGACAPSVAALWVGWIVLVVVFAAELLVRGR